MGSKSIKTVCDNSMRRISFKRYRKLEEKRNMSNIIEFKMENLIQTNILWKTMYGIVDAILLAFNTVCVCVCVCKIHAGAFKIVHQRNNRILNKNM